MESEENDEMFLTLKSLVWSDFVSLAKVLFDIFFFY